MRKYIIPAVEVTALRSEGVIAASFVVGGTTGEDKHEITVGGSEETDDSHGVGQLTNSQSAFDFWND